MFALLKAYVQGRGGVLDDRGVVIDTEMHGEWDPEDREHEEIEDDGGQADMYSINQVLRYGKIWRVFEVCWGVGSVVVSLLMMAFTVFFFWRFSGWIGHSVIGVPGVFGNMAGLMAAVGLMVGYWMMSSRWRDARRAVRAERGERNLQDLLDIYQLVDQDDRCGACAFLLRNLETHDGYGQCPECGAAWEFALWEGFLSLDRAGALASFSKKERRRYCGFDARGQLMLVGEHESQQDRAKMVNACRGRMAMWDLVLLLLILMILAAATFTTLALSLGVTTPGGLIAAVIAMGFLGCVAWYAVHVAKRSIQSRKKQRFVRSQIDDGICPGCLCELDPTAHPLDGALMCPGCLLVWDPDTLSRKHHSRRRIDWSAFGDDFVFVER